MKAAFFETTGAPDVIRVGELPTPTPKAGEVRVKILAASINPIDTYIRSGAAPMALPKPAITGTDLAGVVDAVGSGVSRFKPGDRVWGSNQGLLGRQGTCAEFACVDEQWLYPTPIGRLGRAGRGRGSGRHHGPSRSLPLCRTATRRVGVRQRRHRRRRVDGGADGQGGRRAGHPTVGSEEKAKLARDSGPTSSSITRPTMWPRR